MATAQDIIQDALEKLCVYGPGETMSDADASRGLALLDDMLDSWSNDSLACYTILQQSLVFVPGQFDYTIGPGGFVNSTRPLKIIDQPGSAYVLDGQGNQYQMDVITQMDWNLRGSRNTNSNFPDVLFYDPQYPLGVLNFDPIPNIGYTAYFSSYFQFTREAGLTSPIILPPGYKLAIATNLAIEMIPYYGVTNLSEREMNTLERSAYRSLARVKRTNIRPSVAKYDPEILSKAPGIYSIQTDSYRR